MALKLKELQGHTEIQAILTTLRGRENFLYTHPRDLLCKRCWEGYQVHQTLVREGYIWPRINFSTTLNDLEVGSALCNMCGLLYVTALVSAVQDNAYGSELSRTESFSVQGWHTRGVIQTFWGKVEMQQAHEFQFEIFADADGPNAEVVKARDLLLDVASQEAFDQARSWLMKCERHEHCSNAVESFLPTRIIEVPELNSPEMPRLVDGKGARGHYAALSYCWGDKPQPFKTTSKNFSTYKDEICMSRLPQTIIDAIIVNQRLQIRYLWVDSTCIVQDSRTDKEREISKLRQYFGGSYVTIVAASAMSSDQGFLTPRSSHSPKVRLPLREGKIGTAPATILVRLDRCFYNSSVEPINSRAWTLEEALLSPRALVFASNTLQYRCPTGAYYARSNLNYHHEGLHPLVLKNAVASQNFGLPHSQEALASQNVYLRHSWTQVVSNYTSRKVTHEEDKLVAFAALAEEFAVLSRQYNPSWNSKYLAGLWEHNLIKDLLWHTVAALKSPRPALYLGPTWSWASIDGKVHFPQDALHSEPWSCRIIDSNISLATARLVYGPVTSGTLRISGLLKEFIFTTAQDQIDEFNYFRSLNPVNRTIISGGLILDSLIEEIGERQRVFMVLLAMMNIFLTIDPWLCGLAIVPAKEGCYQRVGLIFTMDDWMFDGLMQREVMVI